MLKQGIRILFLLLSLISCGLVFHELVVFGYTFFAVFGPIPGFIISSLVAILITTKNKIKFVHEQLGGFVVWLVCNVSLICILTTVYKVRDLSPVLLSARFTWEEVLYVEFRENGTYKAEVEHLLGGELSYGKYERADSLIILKDRLKFGMEYLNDTLVVTKRGSF